MRCEIGHVLIFFWGFAYLHVSLSSLMPYITTAYTCRSIFKHHSASGVDLSVFSVVQVAILLNLLCCLCVVFPNQSFCDVILTWFLENNGSRWEL